MRYTNYLLTYLLTYLQTTARYVDADNTAKGVTDAQALNDQETYVSPLLSMIISWSLVSWAMFLLAFAIRLRSTDTLSATRTRSGEPQQHSQRKLARRHP